MSSEAGLNYKQNRKLKGKQFFMDGKWYKVSFRADVVSCL